ncbi:MAG: hypothetical protein EYC70_15865 [Planctomycetota bacterium]|nr:MAG: hypothetical protein EYC70_15865 [Planctomycetota bacterium]
MLAFPLILAAFGVSPQSTATQDPPAPPAAQATDGAPEVFDAVLMPFEPEQAGPGSWPGALPAGVESALDHGVQVAEGTLAFASGVLRTGTGIQDTAWEIARARGSVHAFVQVAGRLRPELFERLHALGIRTFGVFPHQAIQAEIPASAFPALAAMPELRWVGVAPAQLKLHPNLRAELEQARPGAPIAAWVSLMGDDATEAAESARQPLAPVEFDGRSALPNTRWEPARTPLSSIQTRGPLQRALQRAGVRVHYYRPNTRTFAVTATPEQLWALAERSEVHFLDLRARERLFHDRTAAMLGQDAVRGGYNGLSTEVGIIDTGCSFLHLDVLFQAVGFTTGLDPFDDLLGHGTHVAGTILGRGVVSPHYKGMAPGVGGSVSQRVFIGRYFDANGDPLGDVTSLYDDFALPYTDLLLNTTDEPKLINCSWGTLPTAQPWSGTEQECIDVDAYAWTYRQLYVFAAGDGGAAGVAKPAVAKNVLAVGSITDQPEVPGDNSTGDRAATSSMGPAGDGRLKPEIMAPGQYVTSAKSTSLQAYATASGTSYAAPHLTGMLASLAQHYPYFFDTNDNNSVNSPKFLRAGALAAALKKGGARPVDSVYGFGAANAQRLHAGSAGHWSLGWLPLSYVNQSGFWGLWSINVPAGVRRWTIVTCWDEPPPATTGGATPVMGHIDLYLDYDGNQPGGNTGDLVSNGNGNYQYLVIDNPPAGTHWLKFWPRDSDYDDDGVGDNLYYSAYSVMDLDDPRPRADLALNVADAYVKPGESADVTAKVTVPTHVAAATSLRVLEVPAGLSLTATEWTLRDGTPLQYGPDQTEVTLGALAAGELPAPAVDFRFRGDAEGVYDLTFSVNNDNGPDADGHTELESVSLWVDGTAPGPVENLASSTHAEGQWANAGSVAMSWTPPVDDLAGLSGYSVSWAASPGMPDQTQDIGDTSSDSGTPGEGSSFYYSIRAVDKAGNWSPSYRSYGPMKIDVTDPPKPTNLDSATHPAGTWKNNPAVTLTWTDAVDSLSGLDGYSFLVDDNTVTLPDETLDIEDGGERITVSVADGTSYLKLRSVDNAGNWDETDSVYGPVLIDTAAPPEPGDMSSSTHPAGTWTLERFASNQWSEPLDPLSGVDGYSLSYTLDAPAPPDASKDRGVGASHGKLLSSDGRWFFNLRSIDLAGNLSPGYSWYGPMLVDTVAPGQVTGLGSATHPAGTWKGLSEVIFTWIPAYDETSGIDGYSYELNASSTGTPDEVKDIEEVAELSLSPGEGTHYFRIRAVDNAGKWAAADREYGPVKIDLTRPGSASDVDSDHPLGQWTTDNSVSMSWTAATDNLSGIKGYSTGLDASCGLPPASQTIGNTTSQTFFSVPDGIYYFNIRANDNAVNWSDSSACYGPIQIDLTNPTQVPAVSSPTHTAGVWSNLRDVVLNWSPSTDATSGVAGYSYDFNTSSSGTPDDTVDVTGTTRSITAGQNTWYFRIRSVDNAGNASTLDREFGPIRIDLTAPAQPGNFRTTSHTPGAWSRNDEVDLAWNASGDSGGSGLDGYSLLAAATATDPPCSMNLGTVTATEVAVADGTWYFTIRSGDVAGNCSSVPAAVGPIRVDTVVPTPVSDLGSSTHAVNVWNPSKNVSFAWTAGDDALSGVEGYSYELNSSATGTPDTVPDTSATGASLTAAEGSNYFRVRTVDAARNGSSTQQYGPILVDTKAPGAASGFTSSSHTAGTWSNDSTVDLSWTAPGDGAGSGVAGYGLAAAATQTLPPPTQNLGAVTSTTYTAAEGIQYLNLRAVDRVGNWSANYASFGTVRIDLTPPSGVTLAADAGRSYTLDALVNLALSASDPLSGNDRMRFSNDGATWSAWETYATSKSNWDLRSYGGNGSTRVSHTVYAQVRDRAGNVSTTATDQIYWADPLESDASTISYANPQPLSFHLYAGTGYANKDYVLLGSTSTSPGTPLPQTGGGTITLPLTGTTPFFNDVRTYLNTGPYMRFWAKLDAEGKSSPALPPIYDPTASGFFAANLEGRTLYFAYAAGNVRSAVSYDFGYTSPALAVQVVP